MYLNKKQIEFYKEKGYLIIENLFSPSEIESLTFASNKFNERKDLPNVICERNGAIRSIFAPHKFEKEYDWLFRQDRLVVPAEQLIDDQVYLYQFKLNNKQAFEGDWWEWHQDFPYWHFDDGVKLPNMLTAMILMQDTESIQGPLILLPGSHKMGISEFEFKNHLKEKEESGNKDDLMNSLGADLKYTVKRELIGNLAKKEGLVICEGAVGTCVLFHPNLFHASNSNVSPYSRNTALLTYNSVNNLPASTGKQRPDYICLREFEPIETGTFKLNYNG